MAKVVVRLDNFPRLRVASKEPLINPRFSHFCRGFKCLRTKGRDIKITSTEIKARLVRDYFSRTVQKGEVRFTRNNFDGFKQLNNNKKGRQPARAQAADRWLNDDYDDDDDYYIIIIIIIMFMTMMIMMMLMMMMIIIIIIIMTMMIMMMMMMMMLIMMMIVMLNLNTCRYISAFALTGCHFVTASDCVVVMQGLWVRVLHGSQLRILLVTQRYPQFVDVRMKMVLKSCCSIQPHVQLLP